MELEDRLTVPTPEGVELRFTLAGVGSRFVAALIDLTIEIILIVAISLLAQGVGVGFGVGYTTMVVAILSFVVVMGYDVFFEVLNGGRTPGKALNGLRVVRSNGRPVTFVPSSIRNVLRIVDFLPAAYLTGIVAILSTRRNQRIGDLVGDTIVVRERSGRIERSPWRPPVVALAPAPNEVTLDLSAITPEEEAAVRRYLERRFEIDGNARARIAQTLVDRLRPKVAGVPADMAGERFLEAIVAARTGSGSSRPGASAG
jgi:uncharacterized RDD family membrane protein YckC